MNNCRPTSHEDTLFEAFQVFDHDKNGYITGDEMRSVSRYFLLFSIDEISSQFINDQLFIQ